MFQKEYVMNFLLEHAGAKKYSAEEKEKYLDMMQKNRKQVQVNEIEGMASKQIAELVQQNKELHVQNQTLHKNSTNFNQICKKL